MKSLSTYSKMGGREGDTSFHHLSDFFENLGFFKKRSSILSLFLFTKCIIINLINDNLEINLNNFFLINKKTFTSIGDMHMYNT
jgi:hypothetical protein